MEQPDTAGTEMRSPEVGGLGVLLTGSYARGEENVYSDLDLKRLQPAGERRHQYELRRGRLVSLTDQTLEQMQASLSHPEESIWAAPGLAQGRILSDPEGLLAQLQSQARNPPELDGRGWATEAVRGWAEEAHKLLAALAGRDWEMAVAPLWGLVEGLTRAAAVQQRIYIATENRYFSTVAAQAPAEWSECQRQALGLGGEGLRQRCRSALRLYLLSRDWLQLDDPVVEHTCRRIQSPQLVALDSSDLELYVAMRNDLWPDGEDEHRAEVLELLRGSIAYRCYLAQAPCTGQVLGLVELGRYQDRPAYPPGSLAFVDGLYVLPEFRGRGMGETLLRAAIAELHTWRCQNIGSDTWSWHQQSRRLHQRCGFREIGVDEQEARFLLIPENETASEGEAVLL